MRKFSRRYGKKRSVKRGRKTKVKRLRKYGNSRGGIRL